MKFDRLNHPYITIHGPDGAGKTTVGRSLANTMRCSGHSAVFFRDWQISQGQTASLDPYLNRAARDSISRDFVLMQVAHAATQSALISNLTSAGFIVIKDRGILDDRACLHAEGLDAAAHLEPGLREPDLAIFLAVSERERAKRLAARPSVAPYSRQPNTDGSSASTITTHILSQVQTLAADNRGVVIDTDQVSVRGVTDIIMEELRSRSLLVPPPRQGSARQLP